MLELIASTGLRKGEAVALRWEHVDLDAAVLRVVATMGRVRGTLKTSTPKTQRSRREIPLHPEMVTKLRRHRTARKEERMAAANQWADTGLVFTTELGTKVEPNSILRLVKTAAAKLDEADGVGVHTLRHSAAVAWLENGTHIKAVADLLGHSSVAITGDIYGHTSDASARAAITGLGERRGW